jgi:hypothetical protein
MADHSDQMMEWVLGRLKGGVDEGEFESFFACYAMRATEQANVHLYSDWDLERLKRMIQGHAEYNFSGQRNLAEWSVV